MAEEIGKAALRLQLSRREMLAGSAALAAWPSAVEAAIRIGHTDIATGYVFDDASGDGRRRAGYRGLAHVMVSNGRDVVLTDADGRWRLPVRSGDFVFVITPPNFEAPLSEGIPDTFYRYQPEGTPAAVKLRFSGVVPTGSIRRSIDFPLRRKSQSRQFEALLFADMQPSNARELGFVRDETLANIEGTSAAFAINHGDVMGDDLGLFAHYRRLIGGTGIAWHHCPGNHDMNLDTPLARYAFETWKQQIGPTHSAFQHGAATFILLNNVEHLDTGRVSMDGRPYRGRIGETQLAFVRSILRHVPRDHLVAVSMHIPLISFEDPTNPADNTSDRAQLLRILATHPRTVSFSGHSHTTEHHYLDRAHGFDRAEPHHHHVLTAACGSWWSGPCDARGIPVADSRDGTPKGHHVLAIDGNRYTTRFVASAASQPQRLRVAGCGAQNAMQIANDAGTHVSNQQTQQVLIDVFDGGPRTRVALSADGANFSTIELRRVPTADPYVVDLFARNRQTCKPWVAASVSSHIWVAEIPGELLSGDVNFTALVCDEYGAEYSSQISLRREASVGKING